LGKKEILSSIICITIFSILIFSLNDSILTQNAEAQFPIPKPIPQPIPRGAPDLIIESLTHSPANPDTDDVITFKAVVKNIGTAQAGKSTLEFRIGGETPGPENRFSVPALEPGKTYTETRQSTLKTPQNYGVTAIADTLSVVAESNEDNNKKVDTFAVTKAEIKQDSDGDGVPDNSDRCPREYGSPNNAGCPVKKEPTPVPAPKAVDSDRDGIPDNADNCVFTANRDQTDTDGDGGGDACDKTPNGDNDNDSIDNLKDNCRYNANKDQSDLDGDGVGDVCDKTPQGVQKAKPVPTPGPVPMPYPIEKDEPKLQIPSYVKNIAEFWQKEQIDDASFVGAIDYMIETKIITIPDLAKTQKTTTAKKAVPDWVKVTTEFLI